MPSPGENPRFHPDDDALPADLNWERLEEITPDYLTKELARADLPPPPIAPDDYIDEILRVSALRAAENREEVGSMTDNALTLSLLAERVARHCEYFEACFLRSPNGRVVKIDPADYSIHEKIVALVNASKCGIRTITVDDKPGSLADDIQAVLHLVRGPWKALTLGVISGLTAGACIPSFFNRRFEQNQTDSATHFLLRSVAYGVICIASVVALGGALQGMGMESTMARYLLAFSNLGSCIFEFGRSWERHSNK